MAVKKGDRVRLHYTGRLDDGEIFESSRQGQPLELVVGEEMLLPAIDEGLLGHEAGDRFTLDVPADEAFGEWLDELVLNMPLEDLPSGLAPEPGMMLEVATDEGDMEAQVVELRDGILVLDANHPLAGEDLSFEIEILEVKPEGRA